MGADLIGCFSKGPRKLPRHSLVTATAEANWRIAWLKKAQRAIQANDDDALRKLIPGCPWLAPEHSNGDVKHIDLTQLRSEIEHLLSTVGDVNTLTGEDIVKQFVDAWPPEFRDTAHVVDPADPDKVIVFAGERTWGDSPDGAGFKMLMRAAVLGIASPLSVWIEAAFVTLQLPIRKDHS